MYNMLSVKNKIYQTVLLIFLFTIFLSSTSCAYDEPRAHNSCGLLYAIFNNQETKVVNGFLLKKENKFYFITVLHVSMLFDNKIPVPELKEVEISLPKLSLSFRQQWATTYYARGDDIADKRPKETVDVLVVDITRSVNGSGMAAISKDVFDYIDLVPLSMKKQIDGAPHKTAWLIGYPATAENGISNEFVVNQTEINLPESGFGSLVQLLNDENPSGFYFNLRTERGDCGRPVIIKIGNDYKIAGLIKTSYPNDDRSLAIDSTAIIRTIESMGSDHLSNKNIIR